MLAGMAVGQAHLLDDVINWVSQASIDRSTGPASSLSSVPSVPLLLVHQFGLTRPSVGSV